MFWVDPPPLCPIRSHIDAILVGGMAQTSEYWTTINLLDKQGFRFMDSRFAPWIVASLRAPGGPLGGPLVTPVSYTHLTLPTNREV